MMEISAVPRLAPGCRLHPTAPALLVPEGALELAGPAREILLLVDGERTVAAIIQSLAFAYAGVSVPEIERDVLDLLQRLQERGVLRV